MAITLSGTAGITLGASSALTFGDSSTLPSATFSPIYPVSASVNASAMTVTLNPCSLAFRGTPVTNGTPSTVTVGSAITVTIPATATLGTVNAVQSQIVVVAINNAGTVELAVVNIAGGTNLDETTLINTTTIAAASNSSSTVYSTTGRSSVAFRVVGVIISTQAIAGTWITAPSTIQGTGGQALTSMQSLGYGQTWQNVLGSRASGTTYYNTTSRPIFVVVAANAGAGTNTFAIGGITVAVSSSNNGGVSGAVPPGFAYSFTTGNAINSWAELR